MSTILEESTDLLTDPLKFKELCWPHVTFYDDQVSIIESVRDNVETYVPAGNMLGKDFISGFIALWFFCSRSPVRVVTTSVVHDQLKSVLWGEIRRFISTSKYPLGIQVNDLLLRQIKSDGSLDDLSECIGRVAQQGEGMLGRHLAWGPNNTPSTLAIIDEASGFDDSQYKSITTWAHRILIIGNCYPCENFFKKGVEGGDVPDPDHARSYYRKVIKIKAERSPNVRLGLAELAAGKPVSHRELIPGVMSYREYRRRRETWDNVAQTIGLDAEFYKGKEVKLYVEDWIREAVAIDSLLKQYAHKRKAKSIGLDVASGGDNTVWTIGDEFGIMDAVSKKTANTSVIFGDTKALCEEYNLDPRNVVLDFGGGGKEHVDYMNAMDFPVRGVYFGSSPTPAENSREAVQTAKKAYKNKRAEMYGLFRSLLNPASQLNSLLATIHNLDDWAKNLLVTCKNIYAIPESLEELIRQLLPLPLLFDAEGRMYLPPKNKPTPNYTGLTISAMIGCSPDEADSAVLMTYGLLYPVYERRVTVF